MKIRTIHKKFSLEPFKSRVPGRVECIGLDDIAGDQCAVKENDLGNYGHIPYDIEIPAQFVDVITDFTDTEILYPHGDGKYYVLTPSEERRSTADGEFLVICEHRDMDVEVIYGRPMTDGQTERVLYKTIYDGGSDRMFLAYATLKRWYYFFLEYYKGLVITRCDTTQTYDSYEEMCGAVEGMDYNQYRYLDKIAEARGGKDFYEWMAIYCFGRFKTEGTTLWEYMYYPEILREYAWFKERYNTFKNLAGPGDCINREDCCDCQEWFRKGGKPFYNWLNSIVSMYGSDGVDETYESELLIPLLIDAKVDDIGAYHVFASEFDVDTNYEATTNDEDGGTCVLYKGEPYLLKEGFDGLEYSSVYKEKIFGNLDPTQFNEKKWDYDEFEDEGDKEWERMVVTTGRSITITGTCESKIGGLEDDIVSYDAVSNPLPCSFNRTNDGKYVYPFERAILDMRYHPGNVCLLGRMDDNEFPDNYNTHIFSGNVLVFIEYIGNDGTVLIETQTVHQERADKEAMWREGCKCRIGYFVGSLNMTGSTQAHPYDLLRPSGYNPSITRYKTVPTGNILYIDTYELRLERFPYFLNEKSSFKVLYPALRKLGETEFKYVAKDQEGLYFPPAIKHESYMGISDVEKVDADIYIDRGVNAAYEKHYKLGEIRGTVDFEKYGNGAFNIINLKETV